MWRMYGTVHVILWCDFKTSSIVYCHPLWQYIFYLLFKSSDDVICIFLSYVLLYNTLNTKQLWIILIWIWISHCLKVYNYISNLNIRKLIFCRFDAFDVKHIFIESHTEYGNHISNIHLISIIYYFLCIAFVKNYKS